MSANISADIADKGIFWNSCINPSIIFWGIPGGFFYGIHRKFFFGRIHRRISSTISSRRDNYIKISEKKNSKENLAKTQYTMEKIEKNRIEE